MNKRQLAVGELLEGGETVHVAGVTVADATDGPAVHMTAVLEFIDGLRAAIKQARANDLDTVTASNDCNSWEAVLRSFEMAANALAMQVVANGDRKRVRA